MPTNAEKVADAARAIQSSDGVQDAYKSLKTKHDALALAFALLREYPLDNYANIVLFQAIDLSQLYRENKELNDRISAIAQEVHGIKAQGHIPIWPYQGHGNVAKIVSLESRIVALEKENKALKEDEKKTKDALEVLMERATRTRSGSMLA